MTSARRSPRRTGTSAARSQRAVVIARDCSQRAAGPASRPRRAILRVCMPRSSTGPTPERFREVMGHFATGISVVTTFDGDRPAGITVNAFSSVSLEPAARDGRARPAPVHHADGPARRPLRGQRPRRRPAGALRLLRPRAGEPRPRGLLRRGVAARADRPAAHRRLDRHARVHGRRDVQRRRPRPVHRPRRLARAAPRRASRRCCTSGAATCGSSRAPTARSKASRRAECRRSGRTGSTSATTSHGAGPPLVAAPRRDVARRARTSPPSCPAVEGVPRPPAGRARPRPDALGRRATGFEYGWLVDDLDGVRRRARARLVPPRSASRWAR